MQRYRRLFKRIEHITTLASDMGHEAWAAEVYERWKTWAAGAFPELQ